MSRTAPFEGYYVVVPGKLAAGPYPYPDRGWLELLVDEGVRCFVDLTDGNDVAPSRAYAPFAASLASRMGVEIRCVSLGYEDMSTPGTQRMVRILDAIDEAIGEGLPVYVHCLMGLGRTGTVVGCWLARHGIATGQGAIDQVAELRDEAGSSFYPSPVTEEQEDVVRAWPRGL